MGNRRGRVASLRVILAILALLGGLSNAAAQIDTLVQPRGVPLSGLPLAGDPPTHAQDPITDGAQANTYVGIPPPTEPFDNTQPAGVVRMTETTEYYVRFYAPNAPLNPSFPSGPWIMRASTVRGLTPEQIRDRFALPALPTNVENVLVPAGTCVLSGIAGPIVGWGDGGAQQSYLIAHNNSDSCRYAFLAVGTNYINQRPLGANALWYAPVVGPGNAGNVGGYLDHLPAPPEYSDLYNVYNTLDVLNDGTATRLAPALTELTGENHASVLWLALSNTDRAARTLSDHARAALDGTQALVPQASAMLSYASAVPAARPIFKAPPAQVDEWGGRWWAAGGGQFGRVDGSDERSGYHYGGGQGMLGYDWRAPGWLTGAAVAFETSNLTVEGPDNDNTLSTWRAATPPPNSPTSPSTAPRCCRGTITSPRASFPLSRAAPRRPMTAGRARSPPTCRTPSGWAGCASSRSPVSSMSACRGRASARAAPAPCRWWPTGNPRTSSPRASAPRSARHSWCRAWCCAPGCAPSGRMTTSTQRAN